MIRLLSATLLTALGLLLAPVEAAAQAWPKGGPLTIIVPLAPGDAADTTVRAIGEALGGELGTTVVVSNRPGAGGSLGVQAAINARKDGYTLLFAQNSPLTIRRVIDPANAAYDPLKDLVPLAITTRTPSVLVVRKDAPFDTFQEMVAQAKKAPGSVRIGNAGPGSAGDLSVGLINAQAGTEITSVPYKGAAPAVTDVLGGQVEGVILGLGAVAAHMKSGALKPILLSNPFPDLPKVPTLTRLGHKQDILGVWFAFFAPAGTPPEIVQALLPALEKAARDPQIAARLLPMGIVQDWEPASQVAAQVQSEYQAVSDLHKRMGPRK